MTHRYERGIFYEGIGLVARQELVNTMRILHSRGLINTRGGNASIRLEIAPGFELVYITPSGSPKHWMSVNDIAVMTIDGEVLQGKPSSEYRLHLAVYRARRDVRAIVHAHNPLSVAFTWIGDWEEVKRKSLEVKYYVGSVAVVPVLEPGGEELARAVAEKARQGYGAVILSGHGVVGFGDLPDPVQSLYMALDRVEVLEDLARLGIASTILEHQE